MWKGLNIAANLSELWVFSDFDKKRKLQNLVFPEGFYTTNKKMQFELYGPTQFSPQFLYVQQVPKLKKMPTLQSVGIILVKWSCRE
jgi:hypothetical protein